MAIKDIYQFKLEEGDYFEGMCGEIHVTHDSNLVFHCKLCESTFANYAWLLEHLMDGHYGGSMNENCTRLEKYILSPQDKYEGCCAVINITHRSALSYHCSKCTDIYNSFWPLLEHLLQDHFAKTSSEKNGIRQHAKRKVHKKVRLAIKEYNEQRSKNDALGCKEKAKLKKDAVKPNILMEVQLPSDSESDIEKAIKEGAQQGEFYICKTCEGQKFKTLGRFRQHMKQHRTKRKFLCPHCDKAFKDSNTCRTHIRRHLMPKQLKCKHCPKKFFYRGERAQHERCHNNEEICICTICGRGFKAEYLLKAHMRRHNNERPFHCHICARTFFEGHQLKKHLALHSDDRPHACKQCDATFKTTKTLAQHQKLHSNERAYACNMCESSFNQYTALYCHLRNKHKIVDPKSVAATKKKLSQEKGKCSEVSEEVKFIN